ncbi:MAG: Oxygen-independent coproporphyrinogen-III oxidase-like protein [Frankiales bacterium]|nr:Oxygen-independent coproporphyrinogen-III oxidase-like protein [Frankiales bacterium]
MVPGQLPDGEPAPSDGSLPEPALRRLGERPFGVYVHVPFCRTRCGYCDFNTYTDLGSLQGSYGDTVVREIRLARQVLGKPPPVQTVFVGGGTPTLLPSRDLAKVLRAIDDELGLAPGAEVTTEANPDSVDARSLAELRAAGFTRVSFGMQSAVPHVLEVLDRTHTPGRPQEAVLEAKAAGFEQVSLDLIYGAPGESDGDWQTSLDAALAAEPTHVSAYALIVEEGTKLGAQVRRGEVPMPDDDVLADRYLMAEETLGALGWYEVSNWGEPCRHNLAYWQGGDWWGAGPGAHSHVAGVRWWNAKHPTAYAQRLGDGLSPALAGEVLSEEDRRVERVLLEVRLRDGLPLEVLRPAGLAAAARFLDDGLLELLPYQQGKAVLTLRGRLLADAVVRELVD